MGTDSCTIFRTITTWISVACFLLLAAACGDDEPPVKTDAEAEETARPEPVVREWYPRPKHLPQQQSVYVLTPAQQQMPQTQPYQQPAYQQPYAGQSAPGSWSQPGQPQQIIIQQPQAMQQFGYSQRPWETFTPSVQQPRQTPQQQQPQQQQPAVTYPYGYGYGAWPSSGYGYGSGATGWGYSGMPDPGTMYIPQYGGYGDPWGGYTGGGLMPW